MKKPVWIIVCFVLAIFFSMAIAKSMFVSHSVIDFDFPYEHSLAGLILDDKVLFVEQSPLINPNPLKRALYQIKDNKFNDLPSLTANTFVLKNENGGAAFLNATTYETFTGNELASHKVLKPLPKTEFIMAVIPFNGELLVATKNTLDSKATRLSLWKFSLKNYEYYLVNSFLLSKGREHLYYSCSPQRNPMVLSGSNVILFTDRVYGEEFVNGQGKKVFKETHAEIIPLRFGLENNTAQQLPSIKYPSKFYACPLISKLKEKTFVFLPDKSIYEFNGKFRLAGNLKFENHSSLLPLGDSRILLLGGVKKFFFGKSCTVRNVAMELYDTYKLKTVSSGELQVSRINFQTLRNNNQFMVFGGQKTEDCDENDSPFRAFPKNIELFSFEK